MLAGAPARRAWLKGYRRTVEPTVLPISVTEALVHSRLTGVGDEAYVQGLIQAATDLAETQLGLALLTQTWRLVLDDFPIDRASQRGAQLLSASPDPDDPTTWNRQDSLPALEVPRSPLQSITSVKTTDASGAVTVHDASTYLAATGTEPGRIVFLSSFAYPTNLRAAEGLEIVYVAGFGAEASAVPAGLRHALKELVAHLHECRGDAPESCEQWPASAWAAARPYRIARL